MYYRGAQAAIVVYDIANRESFAWAKTWSKNFGGKSSNVVASAGNKADLANKECEEAQHIQVTRGCWKLQLSPL